MADCGSVSDMLPPNYIFSSLSLIFLSTFHFSFYLDVNYSQIKTVTEQAYETLKNDTFFSITLVFGHVV